MSGNARQLFQQYADAYVRGERPRVREFLDQAGDERELLATLIDRYVTAVPVRDALPEELLVVEALVAQEPPLLVLRRSRGLTRDEVVDALLEALGLDAKQRAPLRLRYHELESGQLEAARVDRRVWEALAKTLRVRVQEVAARWTPKSKPPPRPVAGWAMQRADVEQALEAPAAARFDERDPEVDALFGLGLAQG